MELIRTEMTPKERAAAYAAGEEVDRIPTSLSAGETIPPLYGIKISDYYFSADLMVEVESRMAEDFQADNMGIGLGLRTVIEALGTKLVYPEYNVAHIDEPLITSFDDVDNLHMLNIDKDGRLPIIVEVFERLMDRYGEVRRFGSGTAGPFTVAGSLIGTEKLLKATVKNKEGVHKLLQYSTDLVVEVCRDLHSRLGIGFTLSEPMVSKNLLSIRQFREFFLPYLKQSIERMNEFQGKTGIHICGSTNDRWQDVVDAGIASFWVDNCESLESLKNQFGDRISISGNLAPVDILQRGTKEEIEAGVRECLRQAADNPCGYSMSPGCTTPVGTTRENMIAYMNAVTIYGRGAKKGCMPKGMQDFL